METQNELEKEIGTIEPELQTLAPKKVKIVSSEIIEVGEKKNRKVVCLVKHPDKEEQIKISAVSYIKNKKVTETGLWFNLDKDDNIQKGSALATFLSFVGAKKITELAEKEVDTELEGNFLSFKAY